MASKDPPDAFSHAAWNDVILAMEGTYSELVAYQEQLETKNTELEDLRRFLASVLSSVSDLLLVVDKDQVIAQTGGAIGQVLGPDHGAVIGADVTDFVAASEQEQLRETLGQVIVTRQPATLEIEVETARGPSPIDLSIAPRLDERGRSQGAVLVGRPVGELRKAYSDLEESHRALTEAQGLLVRNEKLASLGRLVAGVAHELNNPISFVYANTHALEKYATRFETYFEAVESGAARADLVALREELKLDRAVKNLRGAIDGAKDGAERVRDIVEDLRRLSADGSGEVVDFDLATTARTAADWVARGTKSTGTIHFDDATPTRASGNPGHVQQIIMNLVQNALDSVARTDEPRVTLRVLRDGASARLQVIDNGPGIPEDVAHAIFDPFFTTKPVGEGTGLGLSISHKIAQEHGGTLALVASTPGHTCFELTLPGEEAP